MSAVYFRGGPGRAASCKPASPAWVKRVRHLLTVAGRTPNATAIARVGSPAAARRITCARWTNRRSVRVPRVQRANVARSAVVSANGIVEYGMGPPGTRSPRRSH